MPNILTDWNKKMRYVDTKSQLITQKSIQDWNEIAQKYTNNEENLK